MVQGNMARIGKLVFLLYVIMTSAAKVTFKMAGIVSTDENGRTFEEVVKRANQDLPENLEFEALYIKMDANPIRSALNLCSEVISKGVHTVVVSKPENSDNSPPISVSYTCGFYSIPVIGISARDSSFSDMTVHKTFLRTVPPYFHQADVWLKMLQYFEWNQVVFIHSMDIEGRMILNRFQSNSDEISIEKVIKYPSGSKDYTSYLQQLDSLQSRVILLSAMQEDADQIFQDAEALNLTGEGYAWIVSEQALNSSYVPEGTLGLKLAHGTNEKDHLQDCVSLVVQTVKTLVNGTLKEITGTPSSCKTTSSTWRAGNTIQKALLNAKLQKGKTGQIAFDSSGDRLNPEYYFQNVQWKNGRKSVEKIGFYGDPKIINNALEIYESKIVWPGKKTTKPSGINISTELKIVTLESVPFVYTRKMTESDSCNWDKNERLCPLVNETTGIKEDYCCWGYCIDMLIQIADMVNFTYSIHLGSSGEFGSYKKTATESKLDSFLQPFEDTLWILVALSVHVVALVLYLLDRFSPFGRFKLAKNNDTEEDALNLSSAMWFAWGVLLNSGIGEGTPRSFSARVLGMVWAGFAMIIVASYTANLAAFLVLDRPEASITGIDDARLRNPNEDFKYATVRNSAVEMYFKRQVELSTMYRQMEPRNYKTADEAIRDIGSMKLQAFIWDSSRLEYEAGQNCELITVGDLFGRSGLGVGLQKKSPWTSKISMAILKLHEKGNMEDLDNKWILEGRNDCPEKDTTPATLGLTNMASVFLMVAGGIIVGIILIVIEIAYKRHRGLKDKELELARNAADRWRGNIEKRRTLRQTLQRQREEQERLAKLAIKKPTVEGNGSAVVRGPTGQGNGYSLSADHTPPRLSHRLSYTEATGGLTYSPPSYRTVTHSATINNPVFTDKSGDDNFV
ncbi:glutamate receptor ionotropic, NMDA 1-like isoform X2 [Ostrea edulis]|uniref:glutamate receptor ionotropic, NMDA 1-like isoform X2 n=1 Tax=Ostrea edulis TaxID=37623 RepID=UPI002095A0E7|nr:glutamate receptor ionotropic, NMDA 1-like isoform X2 [Ostrea edulis]